MKRRSLFKLLGAMLLTPLIAMGQKVARATYGRSYWVDGKHSLAGDSAGHGTLAAPFKTLQYAVNQCRSGWLDTVHVAPGHAETMQGPLIMDASHTILVGHGSGAEHAKLIVTDLSGDESIVAGTGKDCVVMRMYLVVK